MLRALRPLNIWLLKSPELADATEVSKIVSSVTGKLEYLVNGGDYRQAKFSDAEFNKLKFKVEVFEEKCDIVERVVETLPVTSRLRKSCQLDKGGQFRQFQMSVQRPFVQEIAKEVKDSIKVDPVISSFKCLDVSNFPESKERLKDFGLEDINILAKHYGEVKEGFHPKTLRRNPADPQINKVDVLLEYDLYKQTAFDLNSERNTSLKTQINTIVKKLQGTLKIPSNMKKIKELEDKKHEFEGKINRLNLQELFRALSSSNVVQLIPNMMLLLEFSIICPISNATVERLFSKLKLVKTALRNQLGDRMLDSLLRIKTEAPDELCDSDLDILVNLFKGELVEKSKTGKIRVKL